jgi:ABC-type transport system substrate-binding protein
VAIQAELSQIGFDVSISQVPDIDAAQKNPTGWTSALEGDGTTSFAGDPITPLQEFFASKGPSNTTGAGNPKLDSLIDQLASTLDASTRDNLLKQTQQIIASNAYGISPATAPGCHHRPGVTTRCRQRTCGSTSRPHGAANGAAAECSGQVRSALARLSSRCGSLASASGLCCCSPRVIRPGRCWPPGA